MTLSDFETWKGKKNQWAPSDLILSYSSIAPSTSSSLRWSVPTVVKRVEKGEKAGI